jgi:hypothetical protein
MPRLASATPENNANFNDARADMAIPLFAPDFK